MDRLYKFDELYGGQNYFYQYVTGRKLSDIYHAHDFYEWVMVVSGSCVKRVDGVLVHMEKDDVLLLRPGESHSFISQSADVCALSFGVRREEFERVCYMYDIKVGMEGERCLFRCSALYERFGALFGDLTVLCAMHDYKLLLGCLLKAWRDITPEPEDGMPGWLATLLREMEKEQNRREGVAAMVRLSNYSQSCLARHMKRYLGMTLHRYVLEIRLAEAYKELLLTAKSAEQIGEEVGYASFSHFQKVFKEQYGITPAGLRKQHGWRPT